MSDFRENEREAWEAAYVAFAREVGDFKGGVMVTLNPLMIRAYAVEAIMEFQKVMQKKGKEGVS